MLIKTRAIVLRSIKYADQKYIVDFYTEQHGRLACAIKVATTPGGRLKRQLFQPLMLLDIEIDWRQREQLCKLVSAQIDTPWTTIATNPVKTTITLFLAEVLWNATRQEQADSQLFQFIATSMQWLDATEQGMANFHIAFLVQLTRFLGIMPEAESRRATPTAAGMHTPHTTSPTLFGLRTSEFITQTPLHTDFLRTSDTAVMQQLLRISYPTMHLFRMSRSERQRCLDVIISYYRLHLPSFPEPKSLQVMHEVFD